VLVLVTGLVVGALGGCGSSSPGSRITIKDFAFRPQDLVVKSGQTITVANLDTTLHGLLADDHSFSAGSINPGRSQTIVVSRTGRFSYHCTFHASMTGVITVKP
jgi:plastocyanin